MRRPGVLAGGDERLFGAAPIAPAQSDGAELHQRPAELAAHPRSQFLACPERFCLGEIARTGDSQQLSAVDTTSTIDAADRGAVAPALHHLGPLPGPVVTCQTLRRTDQ